MNHRNKLHKNLILILSNTFTFKYYLWWIFLQKITPTKLKIVSPALFPKLDNRVHPEDWNFTCFSQSQRPNLLKEPGLQRHFIACPLISLLLIAWFTWQELFPLGNVYCSLPWAVPSFLHIHYHLNITSPISFCQHTAVLGRGWWLCVFHPQMKTFETDMVQIIFSFWNLSISHTPTLILRS